MFCKNCGSQLLNGARFCKECGTQIQIVNEKGSEDVQRDNNGETEDALLKRAYIFLGDREYERARQYFERVLDTNPEESEAYKGLFLIDLKKSNVDDINESDMGLIYYQYKNFRSNFNKVIEYGDYDNLNLIFDKCKKMDYLFDLAPELNIEYKNVEVKLFDADEDGTNMYTELSILPGMWSKVLIRNEGFFKNEDIYFGYEKHFEEKNVNYYTVRDIGNYLYGDTYFKEKEKKVFQMFLDRINGKLSVVIKKMSKEGGNLAQFYGESIPQSKYYINSFVPSLFFEDVMSDLIKKCDDIQKEKESKGCYITSAVCECFNKPDDCEELVLFRRFRDEWLVKQIDGNNLIKRYYETAPQIVHKIKNENNSSEILQNIWNNYISKCYQLLKENKNYECKKVYINMVENLEKQYL